MRRTLLTLLIASLWAGNACASLLVEVSGLSDLTLPTWSMGDPAISAHMDICVSATGVLSSGYGVTVSSANGLKLKQGAQAIPYSLSWDDGGVGNLGTSAGTTLSNNVKLAGQNNANIVSLLCATGPNARLNVSIAQADMSSALSGTYSDTITILITPN